MLVAAVVGGLQNRNRIASLLAEMRLRQMAMIDTLTGAASRRRLEDVLRLELALVQRDRPVSVILLDIERLAGTLRQSSMPRVGRVTASFGVAEALPEDSLRDLVDRADKALYEAKATGRDRVVTASPPAAATVRQGAAEAA